MGRPLKIAKAQALLTVTNTTATTNIVTVSQVLADYGIIAGMPFVPGTTTGTNLVAGTTYWVLAVTGASTFTVSATELSANRTSTAVTLTTGTTGSTLSVGVVDSGFSNPDGSATASNATSYGVVGGNTGIYGKQVLANVAFGVNGTGTLYASDASNVVGGLGTDLGNIAAASIIQYVDSTGGLVTLGYVDTATGVTSVEISNATATGNFLTTVGNAQTLFANLPVALDADIGGLTAGTTYFVKTIANAAAFTVSLTPGGANVGLTNENATSNATQDTTLLVANASANLAGASFVYATPEAGYIVRQKGKTKYLVQGSTSGILGAVYTANVANTALTPNTMSILSTNAASGTSFVSTVNDYQSEVFPATVAAGSLSVGTVYTIYSTGTTDWTAVGSASNMTGTSFVATATGSGTGTAVVSSVNPDVIATFGTAYAANTYGGQTTPIVTINNA